MFHCIFKLNWKLFIIIQLHPGKKSGIIANRIQNCLYNQGLDHTTWIEDCEGRFAMQLCRLTSLPPTFDHFEVEAISFSKFVAASNLASYSDLSKKHFSSHFLAFLWLLEIWNPIIVQHSVDHLCQMKRSSVFPCQKADMEVGSTHRCVKLSQMCYSDLRAGNKSAMKSICA